MKLVSHLLILLVGAGLGVWWGVNHPTEAQDLAMREQAAVSKAKIELLQKFINTTQPDRTSTQFKQMLSDEQQKLNDAKSKLGN